MSTDAKPTTSGVSPASVAPHREQGIRIFMWPKVIFLYPTAIVSLICAVGMTIISDRTHDPTKPLIEAISPRHLAADDLAKASKEPATNLTKVERFTTPQNMLAMLFPRHVGLQPARHGA
jgi:hypothetical protein